jgi:molybdopterin-synthase adenylyltransferase
VANPAIPTSEPAIGQISGSNTPRSEGPVAGAAGGPDRYARQAVFSGVGEEGQHRLRQSRVTLVGCGALGTVLANVLARAGVGFLRIVDRDYVELTNLQRQVLFDEQDAREASPKATAAIEQLQRANSEVVYEAVIADFGADNAEALISDVDLVLDGTDNLETRYVINDACVKLGKPWVYAAAVASYGALMPIIPGETPCLRCVFPDQPDVGSVDTCDTTGVLGAMTGIVANMASIEAIKLLIGAHDRLNRGLTWVDCWYNLFERTPITAPVADCPTCQQRQFTFLDAPAWKRAATMCGRDAVQVRPPAPVTLDLAGLAGRLAPLGDVRFSPQALRLIMPPHELTVFRDGRAIVKGTSEIAVARSLYARLVGT